MESIGPGINPIVLIGGAVILIFVVIIIGFRSHAGELRYWSISAIKIVCAYAVWQALSFPIMSVIVTYTGDPIEQRLFNGNVITTLVYFGLALLVVFTEMRRSQPRLDNA